MRTRIATLLATLAVLFGGLALIPPPAAHAGGSVVLSDSAKTVLTYSASRGCCHNRWMNVKCHDTNSWRILLNGETSSQRCGLGGWIERTWVDQDVYLVVQNLANGNQTAYPPGCNCQIGGGNYIGWLNHI